MQPYSASSIFLIGLVLKMDFNLITIGKTKLPFVIEGIQEYNRRLRHYLPFNIIELPDIKNSKSLSETAQKEVEGRSILSKISDADYVILLDERGKEPTSVHFAEKIEKLLGSGRKKVIFIIGGPYGFSDELYKRADELLSLSKMTFNHEMVRMFFVEQLYRAMTILKGEPYHHK